MFYYEIMDYIFDTTHTIDASTSKFQSSCMASKINNELTTLEEAFDEDIKASFTDEISSISEKFTCLQFWIIRIGNPIQEIAYLLPVTEG